jgi:hypothetical protein
LRSILNELGCDDISAWIGTRALCDPDLLINLIGSKGKVLAFDAAYRTAIDRTIDAVIPHD